MAVTVIDPVSIRDIADRTTEQAIRALEGSWT